MDTYWLVRNERPVRTVVPKSLFNVSHCKRNVLEEILELLEVVHLLFAVSLCGCNANLVLTECAVHVCTLCFLENALMNGSEVDFLANSVELAF